MHRRDADDPMRDRPVWLLCLAVLGVLVCTAALRASHKRDAPAARVYQATVGWAEAYASGDLQAIVDRYLAHGPEDDPGAVPDPDLLSGDALGQPFVVLGVGPVAGREGAWWSTVAFGGYGERRLRWSLDASGSPRLR